MTEAEDRILSILLYMAGQYFLDGASFYEKYHNGGQCAVAAFVEYRIVKSPEPDGLPTLEDRLLAGLVRISDMFLDDYTGTLEHMFMSAGERAVELLVEYGLADRTETGGIWTKAGRMALDSTRF